MTRTTDKLLSTEQLARRLGIHRATAEMMLDPHIRIVERASENAVEEYLRTREPVTLEQMREASDRALAHLETAIGAFLDVDLNGAESSTPPEMQQVSDCFRPYIQKVITKLQHLHEEAHRVIMDCRAQVDRHLESLPPSRTE